MYVYPIVQFTILFSSILAVLSYSFTLTNISTDFPNLSLGTIMGIGMFSSFLLIELGGVNIFHGLPIVFIVGGISNSLFYVLIFKRVLKKTGNKILLTIAGLGLLLILSNSFTVLAYWLANEVPSEMWCGAGIYSDHPNLHLHFNRFDFEVYGIRFGVITSLVFLFSVFLLTALIEKRTKYGYLIRASAEDLSLTSIMGVNPHEVHFWSWFFIGGLVAVCGSLLTLLSKGFPGSVGQAIIWSIVAGSFLGGFDSLYGSLFGGFIAGFIEVAGVTWAQANIGVWTGDFRGLIPICLIIIALIIKGQHEIIR
jgi:branched-subunit amino acid ABC-type transport system permease component